MEHDTINDPVAAILHDMDRHNWTRTDLMRLTGFSQHRLGEFLNRRRRLPLSFIRAYHAIPDTAPLEVLIQDYTITPTGELVA